MSGTLAVAVVGLVITCLHVVYTVAVTHQDRKRAADERRTARLRVTYATEPKNILMIRNAGLCDAIEVEFEEPAWLAKVVRHGSVDIPAGLSIEWPAMRSWQQESPIDRLTVTWNDDNGHHEESLAVGTG